jgi:hypothetical protein
MGVPTASTICGIPYIAPQADAVNPKPVQRISGRIRRKNQLRASASGQWTVCPSANAGEDVAITIHRPMRKQFLNASRMLH